MRIAVFEYYIQKTSPSGKCTLYMVDSLAESHQVVVFAHTFDNPRPGCIHWVRVPVIRRPLVLLYITYHLVAPIAYFLYIRRSRIRFDAVQHIESNLSFGDIVYAHFCHRHYLREVWPQLASRNARSLARWLNHFLHGLVEPLVMRRARSIVVPSQGLARTLIQEYGHDLSDRIHVIPNPVDLDRFEPEPTTDTLAFRCKLGYSDADLVLVFVALGNFEHKGLPELLAAIRRLRSSQAKLLIVGGTSDLVSSYRKLCSSAGLDAAVTFVGFQGDIRPFLWASDAFVLPSVSEVFPLVALEAAAAGLPILATHVFGVEEFVQPDHNGWFVERSEAGLTAAVQRLLDLPREELRAGGNNARASVSHYSVSHFQENWRQFYAHYTTETSDCVL